MTDRDYHDKRTRTIVNSKVKHDSTTAEMQWDMHYLVADIASTITPAPVTSSSQVPGELADGVPRRRLLLRGRGIGTLTNTIVDGPTHIRADIGAQPTGSEEVVSTAMGGYSELRGIRTPSRDLYPATIEEQK